VRVGWYASFLLQTYLLDVDLLCRRCPPHLTYWLYLTATHRSTLHHTVDLHVEVAPHLFIKIKVETPTELSNLVGVRNVLYMCEKYPPWVPLKPNCRLKQPWLTRVCDMTHWYVRHVSSMCVTWLIDMTWTLAPSSCGAGMHPATRSTNCNRRQKTRLQHLFGAAEYCFEAYCNHDSVMCVTLLTGIIRVAWFSYVCDTIESCVWHDMTEPCAGHGSFKRVATLVQTCGLTHSCGCHDWSICVVWLTHVWHDSFMRVTRLIHTCVLQFVLSLRGKIPNYLVRTWEAFLAGRRWRSCHALAHMK